MSSTDLLLEKIHTSSSLFVAESPGKGRGVFTEHRISKDQLIEACPVLLFNDGEDARHIDATPLGNYYYRWKDGFNALALGYGSLYNHSYHPNAYYRRNYANQTIEIVALRDIEPGEEILINYNGDPSCMDPLWFPCVD
ncbi:MAG: SET domain-containing protein [Spirochaetes bacterium]|nr:SET domain-containing protein [Spirochaetota bacterium]